MFVYNGIQDVVVQYIVFVNNVFFCLQHRCFFNVFAVWH